MGGPLCENKIWHFYIINVNLTQTILGVIFFRIWVVWYLFFEFINVRPGRDFINVRGLFIQGGYYIYIYIYMFVYIFIDLFMYIHIYIYIYMLFKGRGPRDFLWSWPAAGR